MINKHFLIKKCKLHHVTHTERKRYDRDVVRQQEICYSCMRDTQWNGMSLKRLKFIINNRLEHFESQISDGKRFFQVSPLVHHALDILSALPAVKTRSLHHISLPAMPCFPDFLRTRSFRQVDALSRFYGPVASRRAFFRKTDKI